MYMYLRPAKVGADFEPAVTSSTLRVSLVDMKELGRNEETQLVRKVFYDPVQTPIRPR